MPDNFPHQLAKQHSVPLPALWVHRTPRQTFYARLDADSPTDYTHRETFLESLRRGLRSALSGAADGQGAERDGLRARHVWRREHLRAEERAPPGAERVVGERGGGREGAERGACGGDVRAREPGQHGPRISPRGHRAVGAKWAEDGSRENVRRARGSGCRRAAIRCTLRA